MALTLTDTLAQEWMGLSAAERQQGFFEYLSSTLQVWGIQGESGWIMLQKQEAETLPLWSHEKLATLWAAQHHPDATPMAIGLNEFKTNWLPGLAKNEIKILVSPSDRESEAIVMTADEVLDALS